MWADRQVVGITEHRFYHISKRPDGVVCFWYKPDSTSASWYPSLLDDNNDPIKETYIDPGGTVKERFAVDPRGIEVFQTKDGPPDEPQPAEFPPPVAQRKSAAGAPAGELVPSPIPCPLPGRGGVASRACSSTSPLLLCRALSLCLRCPPSSPCPHVLQLLIMLTATISLMPLSKPSSRS